METVVETVVDPIVEQFDFNLLLQQQSFTNCILGVIVGLLVVYMFLDFLLRGR